MKMEEVKKIKELAKRFVDVPLHDSGFLCFASHPFTDSFVVGIRGENNDLVLVDLKNEQALAEWRKQLKQQIDTLSNVKDIFLMLNKPYILTFISYIEPMLTDAELGKILSDNWSFIEDITGNRNVNGRKLVKWFFRADKRSLMTEKEWVFYESLPEEVTIYRGVTSHNRRYKMALSWTIDRETAVWFANRFDTGTGEVWEMVIPRERICCFFSRRNEQEVIVNLYGCKNERTVTTL